MTGPGLRPLGSQDLPAALVTDERPELTLALLLVLLHTPIRRSAASSLAFFRLSAASSSQCHLRGGEVVRKHQDNLARTPPR